MGLAVREVAMARKQEGFSLIELMVVVGLIMILAALTFPALNEFLRNYRIRGATQQVAAGLSQSRTKAIMGNVNRGALFVVLPDPQNAAIFDRYQWVMPEQSIPQGAPGFRALDALMADPAQAGPITVLPSGIRFVQGGNTDILGFTRLGAMCDPDVSCGNPPVLLGAAVVCADCINLNAVTLTSTVTLVQDRDQQQRTVTVLSGGRVLAQQ
jgi:prepilin-type N-terminal cleavage/methylation domain-containing protein